jgi:hypothetical protein
MLVSLDAQLDQDLANVESARASAARAHPAKVDPPPLSPLPSDASNVSKEEDPFALFPFLKKGAPALDAPLSEASLPPAEAIGMGGNVRWHLFWLRHRFKIAVLVGILGCTLALWSVYRLVLSKVSSPPPVVQTPANAVSGKVAATTEAEKTPLSPEAPPHPSSSAFGVSAAPFNPNLKFKPNLSPNLSKKSCGREAWALGLCRDSMD